MFRPLQCVTTQKHCSSIPTCRDLCNPCLCPFQIERVNILASQEDPRKQRPYAFVIYEERAAALKAAGEKFSLQGKELSVSQKEKFEKRSLACRARSSA